ncbi:LPD38 domain-containing protein [Paenibacillus ottowii]|uniref:Large polyvalent protein associated domain-containing protein n=1 Tax=Paenibacillus ottowii TaxID=2315729 RepID=A0ABY3B0U4_9BACL|nr:LPD38 domain-containing protein [Paenibacillus ottowii]TQR97302.1 hypothetical protein FKV70_18905 [Paenibacillus ottowii]
MASRYEQFVEQQRKRAQQIKTDALNGTLQRQQPQQRMNRRTAAFEANVSANPKLTDTSVLSALPDALKIGPGFIENSTLARASAGNQKAKDTYKAATGLDIQPLQGPPNPTEYQLRISDIRRTAQEHPYMKYIQPFAEWGTGVMSDTDAGNFANRMISTGGGMVIGDRPYYNVTTGNATADKVADYAGNIGGVLAMGFNPAAPGVKGQNLLTGPLEAAEGVLATRAGNALTNTISRQATRIPGVSAGTADRFTRGALTGAAAGAVGNTAIGINHDQTTGREMLHNAAVGAAFGAGGDVALRSLGGGVRTALTKIKGDRPIQEIEEMLALPLGRTDQRMAQARQRSNISTSEGTIVNPTDWRPEPLALPSGRNAAATTGRLASNPYRVKFENLMRVANQTEFTPGREAEELEQLWGSMANRQDPGLSELIDRAYPATRRQATPDLIQTARQNQATREKFGVPLPVRETQANTFIGEAAAPRQRFINTETNQVQRVGKASMNTQRTFDISDPAVPNYLRVRQAKMEAGNARVKSGFKQDIADEAAVSPTNDIPSAPVNAAPMKQNWFTNLFGNGGVGISPFGSSKRINAGPLTTADQIVRNSIKNDVAGIKSTVTAEARAAYHNIVDRLDPLKKIGEDTYEAAMDATARSNNIANTIVRDKFVTPEGQVIGPSLNDIFKKVARGQDKAFVDYLTLRHAKTRIARGEKVYAESLGMTPDKIQARIEVLNKRHPGFKEVAQEWDQFNENILRYYGVKEGLISENLFKSLRQENPNYSPMRRQFKRSEKPGRKFLAKTTSSSFSGQKAPLQKVSPTGSMRDIVDPRKTTVEMVGAWTNASMNNRVMQSIVSVVAKNPEQYRGVAEIVQKPKGIKDLRKILQEDGMDDFVEAMNDDFKNLFKTTRMDQDNIVRAMVKGEPVYVQIHDPEMVKTLIGMGPQASNILIDVASAFSNATKRGATGLFAPVFAIKSTTMDLAQSAIQSRQPLKQAGYTVYSIFSGIGDRLRIPGLKNLAEEYRRAGGEYSAALKGDRKLNRNISAMTRDPLLTPKGIVKGAGKLAATPFKMLESVGNIAENAPRMAAYKLELQRLGGERTPENIRQAMKHARESTVNFSRRGALSRDIEAISPYSNAAVQGTYRVLKGLKQNPVRTLGAIAMVSVLPKIYEYSQFSDDPDYDLIPTRERYRFLYISKNDDGTFNKIPMEPQYNSFGEITIEALRHFKDNDPHAFKDAMDSIVDVWTPPVVSGALKGITRGGGPLESLKGVFNSTILSPGVALVSNEDYAGRPIESQDLEGNSPINRYDERTSGVAIKLGETLNMSPKKVDYLLRAYGGDPARLILPLTSEQGAGDPTKTLLRNFISDPQFSNTLNDDFYRAKDKLTQAYKDLQDGKGNIPTWYNDELRKTVTSQANGSLSKRLSELRNQKREIGSNISLSPREVTEQQRVIQQEINKTLIDINQQLEEAGVPLR